ncbi:MAG: DUF1501 domain-containing protein, partial [Planctomycetia bacterium]|nr:DUF1501 domain-containing protein [Planctomycetia bacterium]
MDPLLDVQRQMTRRSLFCGAAQGVGRAALASLLADDLLGGATGAQAAGGPSLAAAKGLPELPHFAPKAKRVVYLFQAEGPSHVDLFDYKPIMRKLHGTDLPASIKGTQRVTGMTSGQQHFPVVAPLWPLKQCGERQTWISDLLPYTQQIADDITIIKS